MKKEHSHIIPDVLLEIDKKYEKPVFIFKRNDINELEEQIRVAENSLEINDCFNVPRLNSSFHLDTKLSRSKRNLHLIDVSKLSEE